MSAKALRVLVLCADGVATSTIVLVALREVFEELGLNGEFTQGRITDAGRMAENGNFDLVVSTAGTDIDNMDEDLPIIGGIPFLTGIGKDPIIEQIKAIAEKKQG